MYYERDLALTRALGDQLGEGVTLCNLANAHQALGHVEDTLRFHQKHLDIVTALQQPTAIIWALGNLGTVYAAIGMFDAAIEHFDKQGMLAEQIGDRRTVLRASERSQRARERLANAEQVEREEAIAACEC